MSEARANLDWEKQFELALDQKKAERRRKERPAKLDPETCSMCSEFCALKMVESYLEEE